jgi:hypothetical protein
LSLVSVLLSASLFPFFFEQTVGLVSLGSPLGAIVAYNASLGAGHRVIRAAGLGGLPGGTAVDCADGVLVAGVVDFHAKQSPMLLLAVDLQHGGVLHNATADPPFAQMQFALATKGLA